MGNEDVVAYKTLRESSDKISASIDSTKQTVEKLSLDLSDNKDETDKRVDFVEILPLELIEEIFLYLCPKDLAACTLVRTSWREAVNSNKIWGYHCDKKGWKDDFDPNFSHFYKAHKQFRKWAHSYDLFSPICQKRLLYNKHCCLQENWRTGKYISHKISYSNQNNFLHLFEPVTCDGRYLVMLERGPKVSAIGTLAVWSLDGVPTKLCNLPLPNKVQTVEAIAFDHGTIAVAQSWVIIIYHLKNDSFNMEWEKQDLRDLEPKAKLPKEMKRMTPFLKITQDFIICVPSHSHSTIDFIPIFFWDRESGELKHTLSFDSMYYVITNVVWSNDSCYLSLTNKKKKSYQIVEFGLKSATWEAFSQSVTVEVEQITVSNQYILAVTKTSNPSIREYFSSRMDNNNKELWLWDRATGSALKTFEVQGKGFHFINDYLMYFDNARVKVMNPKDPDMCSEFETNGNISSIRAAPHPSILVIIKTGYYIEVWDWGKGCRLYTVAAETGYGSQLWCDDKRIITYHSSDSAVGGGIQVLGFW